MRQQKTDRGAINILKTHFSRFQIADRDHDEDRDPYTAAAWAPMTLSNGATGTINWVTDFGLPEIPKSVSLYIVVRDAASAGTVYTFSMKAKSTTTNIGLSAQAETALNDGMRSTHGPVAVADNGTSYWACAASGVNTMDVWIRVVDWIK